MKKVAIIGYASNWKEAPWNDPECEIWCQNICEITKSGFPRAPDAIFDIHSMDIICEEEKNHGASGMQLVKSKNIPCYLIAKDNYIPSSHTFPLDELTRAFFPWAKKTGHNKYEDSYWTSSTQMMIALAIHMGYTEIGIYGIDMADTEEYRAQRRGCEYMLGIAVGKGITVKRSSSSPVLRTKFIYGYEQKEEESYRQYVQSRKEFLQTRIDQLNATGMSAAAEKSHLQGALHVYQDIMDNWLDA